MKTIVLGLGFAALTSGAAFGAASVTYSVDFPCKATSNTQTVTAAKMNLQVTSKACTEKDSQYTFASSDFPKGFIAKKTAKVAYDETVAGAASNVGGTVRSDKPVTVGGVLGRDALIDIKKEKLTAHLRVFFVGDRQYQVVFVGPAGQENGKAAVGFLGSFKSAK